MASAPAYQRILVPLDHTVLDSLAVGHAAAMAKQYGARVYLLHIEEDVTSRVYGDKSSTAEVEAGETYIKQIAQSLREQGISVETSTSHGGSPAKEIVRYASAVHPDLVIMGAHGHGGLKDLIFGNTINPVRHHLAVPMLIVRPPKL
jgi:manganese transport protein